MVVLMARAVTKKVAYYAPFDWAINMNILNDAQYLSSAPRIAVIREEGSNGDREMAAAFTLAGFQTYDVTMTDMLAGHTLDAYRGIAFVGGFSFADVLGSAKGWAATIQYNAVVRTEFERFKNRSDTLSLGVCNGCQLMSLLGWVGEYDGTPSVFLDENLCGRFESVFGPVRIEKSKAIMLRGMEGAILGLWSSHGEGRFTYRTPSVHASLKDSNLIAIRYADSEGNATQMYPGNPNGSQDAVAGICSKDGRHLAMMPHPDRAFMEWHWAEYPRSWRKHQEAPASPWIKMFQNAFEWIKETDVSHQA
uniref:Glutamine amidotransferase type-1 domain-containing protein n=1 Tax=Heterorhabditis bacteriophora TaxID=37862 RepID=A0A1I7XBE4_HETBA